MEFGGLGVRETRLSNMALLGKLVWSLLQEKNHLSVQVVSHKYLGPNSVWSVSRGPRDSIIRRSILKVVQALRNGFDIRLGPSTTSLWYKDWLGYGPLCNLVNYVHILNTNKSISDIWEDGVWNLNTLATSIPMDISSTIQAKPVPTHMDDSILDYWVWKGNKEGICQASADYQWLLSQSRVWDSSQNWDWIWRIGALAKVSRMLRLCIHNSLPTNSMRQRCGLVASVDCPRCSNSNESILHCLRDCPHAKEVWFRIGMADHNLFLDLTDVSSWIKYFVHDNQNTLFMAEIWWIWRVGCNFY